MHLEVEQLHQSVYTFFSWVDISRIAPNFSKNFYSLDCSHSKPSGRREGNREKKENSTFQYLEKGLVKRERVGEKKLDEKCSQRY